MILKKRVAFFAKLAELNPNPKTELEYESPFQLLIAVLLSAQATDIAVNKATRKLFAKAPTAYAMSKLSLSEIESYINTIGLYRNKAAHTLKTCQILCEHYQGEVPANREALESLPGVGRKTANVVLNTAFGHPTIAVDTHIFRVSNRTKLAAGKNVLEVEKKLEKVIPKPYLINAHHWLILHGRYICKARKPDCDRCPVVDLCPYPSKNLNNAPL